MSTRIVCPACDGGRTKERSCLISERDGVTFYHCFRASCPHPSGVYSGTYVPSNNVSKLAPPLLSQLPSARRKWLASKFDLTDEDLSRLRPLWVASDERYWFPTYDQHGVQTGGVARSYTGKHPKSLTYTDEWSTGCWYVKPNSSNVWLVEDQMSACKMARHATSVALLGTSLGGACRGVLATLNKPIVVALDADAWHLSVALSLKLQDLGMDAKPLAINQDIKDMYSHEVQDAYTRGS